MEKKMNNKGFSLVELIVVIAIMAVLIGVLAPQFLRYVEQSRLQKDNQAIAEIANACKIAMADETINTAVGTTGYTITITGGTAYTFDTTKALENELSKSIGTTVNLTSNTYSGDSIQITTVVTGTGSVTVSAVGYMSKTDATATTSANPQVF